jgi:Zn-dependent protease
MSPEFLTQAVAVVVFVFSLVVHENAHGLTAERFGDSTARDLGRITMNPWPHIDILGTLVLPIAAIFTSVPLIGWAKPVPVDQSNLRNPVTNNAVIAAAGPASNLMLATASALLWIGVGVLFQRVPGLAENGERSLAFFNTLFYQMISINCLLAFFNLLPIPPLDGHWILMRYLPPGPRTALASIGPFGFLILLALLWTGILWRIIGPVIAFARGEFHALVVAGIRALS